MVLPSILLELDTIIEINKPEVLGITESKMNPSMDDEILGFRYYNIWRKDKVNRNGGGVDVVTRKEKKNIKKC